MDFPVSFHIGPKEPGPGCPVVVGRISSYGISMILSLIYGIITRESFEPKGCEKIFFNSIYNCFFFIRRKHSIRERYGKDLIGTDCRLFSLVSCFILIYQIKEAISLRVPENVL